MDHYLRITYHNATGKRNMMTINMARFFPCSKTWLTKLIRTVIDRSDERDEHLEEIAIYLEGILASIDNGTCQRDYSVAQLKRIRECLDLIGGIHGTN